MPLLVGLVALAALGSGVAFWQGERLLDKAIKGTLILGGAYVVYKVVVK